MDMKKSINSGGQNGFKAEVKAIALASKIKFQRNIKKLRTI